MRLHFLDLECLCFGVIHQAVVLRLVVARRRIVAEGKAAPKLLRHAGDGVLKFVVDGRLACAKHNLGIRAQLGGVYRAAPAIQAEAAGDVYRALQRNLRISILQIQRTIAIIIRSRVRIRRMIGECAVFDDVLAGAKLHGAAKGVRRRYRHMVQTCGVVLAGVLDLAHINAAGHSQIFQHQTIGRIILIPAVATIAKIDASINGAWMFGAVGDGQFLPCGVRAIERAPSLSGSKLQYQIVTIQAQAALPIHRKAMAAVISFLDRPCNILGQIQVIGGNGICLDAILCGNILRQRLIELRSVLVAVLRRGVLLNACGAFAACPGVALRHGEVLLLRSCPHRVRKVQADSLKTERDGRSAAEAVTQCDLVVVRRGKHCPEHCALFDLGILQFAVQLQCAAGAVRYIGIFRAGIRHQRPAVQVCLATGQLEEVSGVLALLAVVLQRQRAPIHIRRAAADREHIGIRSKAAAFQVHRAVADRKIGRAVAEIQIIIRRRAAAVAHIQTDTVGNSQRFDIQRTGIIDRSTIVSARTRLYACAFNGGRSGLTHAHQMGIATMSLYGNISQRRIGGIRHADAMNRVKRYLIQLHLCVSVAADCVAQVGVPRQGGKDDIGEVRCSIVEFKATPADCEATAGYGDCSRKIRSRCAARAHQHTESFVLLHPGAAGDGQRAAVHADQRLIVIVAAVAVCICRRYCQRAAGNIHCCAADNIPDRPERSDRAALDGDRVGVGALSAAGNAHRFFCLQRAAFQRKVRRGRQLDAAVRQLTAAGEFVLNGQRAAVLHFHMIICITAVTVSTLAKAQRIAVQADRNIAANREVMSHLHRLRQIVASCRQLGVGVLDLFVGRTVVLVLSCQFQRKGLGRCVILYCIVRVSGRYGGGQVFRHVFHKHTRRLHDDLHVRRCVALFQHSYFGVCAEINGAVCHLHVALCGEAGVLVDNVNGVIAGVGPIGAACQNHRTAIQHDNVFLQILCGGSAGNRQRAVFHNDLSVAGGFHVRQVHVACVVQHHAAQNKAVAPHGHSAAVVDQSIFRARAKIRVREVLPVIELKRAVRLDPDHRFRAGRGEDNTAVLLLHTFHAAASCHNGRAARSGSAAGDPRDLHLAAGYMDGRAVAHGGERACQPRRTRRVGEHRTCTVVDHGDLLDVHRTAVDDGGRGAVVRYSAEAFISTDAALVMAAPCQRAGIHNSRFAAAVHVDAIIIIVINAITRRSPSDFPQLQRAVVHNLTIDGALGIVPSGCSGSRRPQHQTAVSYYTHSGPCLP